MLIPLQHCHSVNMLNLVGIDQRGGVFAFNVDCMGGILGAEVVDIAEEGVEGVSEGRDGNPYLYGKETLRHYDMRHRRIVAEASIRTGSEKVKRVGLINDCLLILKETFQGKYLQLRYVPDVLGYGE